MAYVPITVGTGTIDSSDVQPNLDKMKNYVDGSIIVSDLGSSSWCESKHIMRGSYNPIVNQHNFTSGVVVGHSSEMKGKSFVGDGPTARGGGTADGVSFPKTAITFELERTAHVMFQFNASPISPPLIGITGFPETHGHIVIDGVKVDDSLMTSIADLWRIPTNPPNPTGPEATNNFWSGFYLAKNLAAGKHSFGLQGFCKGRYTFLVNWSVSMEAYYL